MGQEAGKSAWPKPSGGYQTITGRRYGRRHAYVTFRPTSSKCRVASAEDQQEMEMNSVEGERPITTKGTNISSMLQAIFPKSSPSTVHPELALRSTKDPPPLTRKQGAGRGGSEGSSGITRKKLRSDRSVAPEPMEQGAEASAWPLTREEEEDDEEEEEERRRTPVSPNPSTLSFVNIDSYEPDSSDADDDEDDDDDDDDDKGHDLDDSGTELDPASSLLNLDSMISELDKDYDYLSGLHSYLRNRLGNTTGGGGGGGGGGRVGGAVCDGMDSVVHTALEEEASLPGRVPIGTRWDAERECERPSRASCTDTEMDSFGVATVTGTGMVMGLLGAQSSETGSQMDTQSTMDSHETAAAVAASASSSASAATASTASVSTATASTASGVASATAAAAATSEMVVRPKIRKQTSESHLEKKPSSSSSSSPPSATSSSSAPETLAFGGGCGVGGVVASGGGCSGGGGSSNVGKSNAGKLKCGSAPPFFLTQTERPGPAFLFDLPKLDCCHPAALVPRPPALPRCQDGTSAGTATTRLGTRRTPMKRPEDEDDDEEEDDFWEDLEELGEKIALARQADESSECSEGEWSASWASDSGLEPERRSSEESWETLPWLDELPAGEEEQGPGAQTSSPLTSTTDQEPAPLEEGEIPWLVYNQDGGSSSDEEGDGLSHFVHPGLFILDGNNNLEDDSSVSEDLDTEWRLLNDFGEGMAQAMSYLDPQLLTFMALEERLAQAMEAALAHLESLAIEVEQAHPPATEQIIECLPQITIDDHHSGQEQCCAICCSEYVNGEIATQLPCQHMFHKLCVTLWLRKSGTCPVCRHVLSPPQPDPPVPVHTSFTSEQEGPPSNHSAGGTR